MTTTTSTNFNPPFADLLLECYSRIQIRPTGLQQMHMRDALMSAQLLMVEWQTKPSWPNLWKIQELTIPLVQGVATYSLPSTTVGILDYFVRVYDVGDPVNVAVLFTTTLNSTSVKINYPNHGLSVGSWMSVVVPVSIGGIVLQGFYQVVTVPDANDITVTAASAATSSVSGGAVPIFTTTINATGVTVTLPNHGYQPQQTFNVQVSTVVGGVTFSGAYTVQSVPTANTFVIAANVNASSTVSGGENSGLAQLEGQVANSQPQDRTIFPISRSEYSAQPDKVAQAYPSTVWFDRLIQPTLTFWPVPDGNGPYVLHYYAMTQSFDVSLTGGYTVDVPWRFLEAFCAGLAAKLAVKYPPPMPNSMQNMFQLAQAAWDGASKQDVEETPLYLIPGLGPYARND